MRFNLLIGVTVVALLPLMSCNSPSEPSDAEADKMLENPKSSDSAPKESAPAAPEKLSLTRGDVEANVWCEAVLDPKYQSPTVQYTELKDARPRVNMGTVTLTPPFPTSLPIAVFVKAGQGFKEAPVVLRARVVRTEGKDSANETVLDTFNAIISENPRNRIVMEKEIDVLAGVQQLPESYLVLIKAEALLMPEGTDPATLDLATATTSSERIAQILSNPLRIVIGSSVPSP